MPDYPEPIAQGGSAMCYGRAEGEEYVWLMHGPDIALRFQFHRYDIEGDSWQQMASMPNQDSVRVGWGGALAYVPASQDSGWILGLKGNETREFYAYYTERDQWVQCPVTPTAVGPGGALCYGGTINSIAFVYAQTGEWYSVGNDTFSHFYRFRFHIDSGPGTGEWQLLRHAYGTTDSGAALTWCELPQGSAYGVVFRILGIGGWELQGYDVQTDSWSSVESLSTIGTGGAMATGSCNDPDIYIFRGSTLGVQSTEWWIYYAGSNTLRHIEDPPDATWRAQQSGAAICHDGQHLYAQLGDDQEDPFGFRRYVPDRDEGGAQGSAAGRSGPAVRVVAGSGAHWFSLTGARPGPAVLRIFDPAGRMVSLTRTAIASGENELVWHHGQAGTGVYFYRIETPAGSAVGKLTVIK